MKTIKVGIVGAGFAGLVCANELRRYGAEVTIFDKGRFAGGRLASRQRDINAFDYGAQYFTVKNDSFREFLLPLLKSGKVAAWNARFGNFRKNALSADLAGKTRYVGVPYMRSLIDELVPAADCLLRHRVRNLERESGKWTISGDIEETENGNDSKSEFSKSKTEAFSYNDFSFLVLNLPPAQAQALQPQTALSEIELLPCIALLLSFETRLNLDFDGISLDDEIISWVARDSSKPGRQPGERWVIHASPHWSKENFETEQAEIEKVLLNRFREQLALVPPKISFAKLHKWRYALPAMPLDRGCISVPDQALVYCGDWCVSPRVEGAFLSGMSAAAEINRIVKQTRC